MVAFPSMHDLELVWQPAALRKLMKRKGASPTQVAAAVGVTAPTVTNWLNGSEPRRHHHRVRLSEFLGVTPDTFYARRKVKR